MFYEIVNALYDIFVYQPIYRLYRNGPSLRGYGFQRGAPSAEICFSLTNVESNFWVIHAQECEALIQREVQSYIVLLETLCYFSIAFLFCRFLLQTVCGFSLLCAKKQVKAKIKTGSDSYRQRNSGKRYFTPSKRSTPIRAVRSSPLKIR